MMLRLHHGELDLEPLDVQAAEVSALVGQVETAAIDRFGCPLRRGVAISALEISRAMPGASGYPQLDEALSCLRLLPATRQPPPPVVHPPPLPSNQATSAPAPPAAAVPAQPLPLRPGLLSVRPFRGEAGG